MKRTVQFSLIISFIFMLLSCEKNVIDPPQNVITPQLSQSITILEARDYIDNLKEKARKSANSDSERNFIWDNARTTNLKDGKSIVIAPINYNNSARISSLDGETFVDGKDINLIGDKVLFYKNDSGDIRSVLLTIIPDKEYRAQKNGKIRGMDFSGYVLVSDIETEEVITAWIYKNGEDVKQAVVRSKKADAHARLRVCAEAVVDVFERQNPNGPGQVGSGDNSPGTSITVGDVVYVKTGTKTIELGDCGGGDNIAVQNGSTTASAGDYNWNGNTSSGSAPSPFGDATMDDYDNFGRYIGSDPYHITLQRINDLDARGFGSTAQERTLLLESPSMIDPINEYMDTYGTNTSPPNLLNTLTTLIGTLTPEEKQLLGEGSWTYHINLLFYAANANAAQKVTFEHFPNDYMCAQCKANAFKHALFRMLDSDFFGSVKALQLGVAHEPVALGNVQ